MYSPAIKWDKMKTIDGQKLLGFWNVSLECFKGLLTQESQTAGVTVISSLFPCVRGLGKGEATCEDGGKEINVEQAGKEHTWAQEARDPGKEMKEMQAPQTRPRPGVNTVQEPRVLI